MKRLVTVLALLLSSASTANAELLKITGGNYEPFYPTSPKEKIILVKEFMLDKYLVTNKDFSNFVQLHPQWRRDKVSRLYVDKNYLSHWNSPVSFGANVNAKQPITNISWFAAKAYCEAKGQRLANEYEWEYAAQASDTSAHGNKDLAWRQKVLNWYSRPNEKLGVIGSGLANYWHIQDMHGLIWEWVADFNSNYLSVDSREGSTGDKMKFCGAGSFFASEKTDYPSFMRNAMRSSLKGYYSLNNLGFRCAKDGNHEILH